MVSIRIRQINFLDKVKLKFISLRNDSFSILICRMRHYQPPARCWRQQNNLTWYLILVNHGMDKRQTGDFWKSFLIPDSKYVTMCAEISWGHQIFVWIAKVQELSFRNSCLLPWRRFISDSLDYVNYGPMQQYKFENMYTFIRYLVYVVMVLGVLVLWDMFINEIMVLIFLLSYSTVDIVCYIVILESLLAEQSNSRMVW